jgi:hypothetical protein
MGKFLLLFGLGIFSTFIRAVCFVKLWVWFAVGFLGIAAPSIPLAMGLLTLASLVLGDPEGIRKGAKGLINKDKPNEKEAIAVLTFGIVFNLIILLTGWIIKVCFL